MKRVPILTIIAFVLLAFSSCKSKTGLFIPADAVTVIHINPSSLESKMSWSDIKNSDLFKEVYQQAEDDTLAKKILDNPEASGIDMKGDFFLFFAQHGRSGYSVMEGFIKDVPAFEAINKKLGRNSKVEKDGGYQVMKFDNSTLVAWNEKKFAYINDMPEIAKRSNFGNRRSDENRSSLNADTLRIIVKSVLDNEGNSLHDDDRFSDLVKEKGDVHFWFNSSAIAKETAGDYMSLMNAKGLIDGNATGMILHFDDGKIVFKSKTYLNEQLAKAMEKHEAKNINTDVLNRIPSQNVAGVIASNINLETIKEIIKVSGLDGLVNSFLSRRQLSLDGILSAFNGQFVFAVSDLTSKAINDTTRLLNEKPSIRKKHSVDYNMLFATGVGNLPSFQKLFDMVAPSKKDSLPFSYKISNQWFVVSKNQQTVDAFLSGNSTKQPWVDKIAGHPFGLYINLQYLLNSKLAGDSTINAALAESAMVWQDIVATGGDVKNGIYTAEFTINMVDKKTNSLKQLHAFIGRMNDAKNKWMRNEMQKEFDMDDDSVVPPKLLPPVTPN